MHQYLYLHLLIASVMIRRDGLPLPRGVGGPRQHGRLGLEPRRGHIHISIITNHREYYSLLLAIISTIIIDINISVFITTINYYYYYYY